MKNDDKINNGDVVLSATNLSMRFGGVIALDNVSLSLRRNELRCLIGPNGAGKSTFFRCVSGQHCPSSGSILINGINCVGMQIHEIARLRIALKTQVPSLMNGLSVSENLWLGARAIQQRSATDVTNAIDSVLSKIPVEKFLKSTTGVLSHGQRQLVELAVVLASSPEILLLDEPAGGLTHDEVVHMANLIKGLKDKMTIMVVEHDMTFIRQLSGQVSVFNQGSILTEGHVREVLEDERVRAVYLGRKAV